MKYISVSEAAKKWNINERRVRVLLKEKRIEGAILEGHRYLIPENATKPLDRRVKGQRLFEDSPLKNIDFDFANLYFVFAVFISDCISRPFNKKSRQCVLCV